MEKDISVIKEIANAASLGLDTVDFSLCRGFISLLDANYRIIKNAKERLCRNNTSAKELTGTAEWLGDNFYLIHREFQECKRSLKNNCRIPCISGIPRVSRAFIKFAGYADFSLDSEGIREILSSLDSKYTLTSDEFFLARPLAALGYIICCAQFLSEYESKPNHSSNEEKYAMRLGDMITSLRCVSIHNFGKDILEGTSAKILAKDPAGCFTKMSDSSKIMYINRLSETAKKQRKTEKDIALELVEKAEKETDIKKRHIGYYLMKRSKLPGILYAICISVTPFIPILYLSFLISPLFILAFLPVWEMTKIIIDYIFSKAVKSLPLPRMELTEIPNNAATLVVITSLLTGESGDCTLFDRLERIFRANNEKNVYFGILADIRDSKTAKAPGDEKTLAYAYGRIESLCQKYGKKFILFERKRIYSKSEEIFMGYERKRGAVCELVDFLRGESTTFTDISKSQALSVLRGKSIKYVVTLDADTNLGLGAVKEMCSIMMHPLATPVIDKEKGIVTDGHGIMQPRCAPDLAAAGATPFSGMMCGEGGSNIYSHAAFDVYQSLFGEGIFCGKGIFDVDAFYRVINKHNTFPEDRILSHDSLEGAKLRSALISDIELTDGFPKTQLSYLKRRHRWIRGDIQNLPFLCGRIRFSSKDIRKNNISSLSKFKLFDNVRSALVPLFSFICIFCAMTAHIKIRILLVLFALMYILLPFILNIVSTLPSFTVKGITRKFFSKGVTTGLWQSLGGMFLTLAMLPSIAVSTLDAVSKSLFRMVFSKKKLLEWQTAAGSEKTDSGLLFYVHKNLFSAISGFILFVFSPAGILRALAILWFSFPVISYHTSKKRKTSDMTDKKAYREKARSYATDIWSFFRDNVSKKDNYLPPDNIQLAPHEAVAHRTSPTNIGLYLLSVLCARDFGFIDTAELEKRLDLTLSTVEKLEKFKGHLYNWYDTETLSLLVPKYISTVDSGNLTACLITLRMGLRDYVNESTELLGIIKRIEKLEEETDYSFLYNSERELFSLGAEIVSDGKYTVNDSCYDLMMSEARTISYIQCAKRQVPKKHWTSLSRALVSSDGYIGLSSWTGTAFEYFMPPIFLPLYKRSLHSEAMSFAMHEQAKRSAKRGGEKIFGISESAYYSFDSEMNYRYRAFGIPSLAYKTGLEKELVISPYSTFLGLCSDKKKAFANLDVMSKAGLYGKYGLYEAIDFTKGRCPSGGSVVKSYMSHHMGMSFCALCNAAFGNILQKRFMQDSAMNCARELLEEKIPVNAVIRRPYPMRNIPSAPASIGMEGKIYTFSDFRDPDVALLSNGNSKIFVSGSGHVSMQSGNILANYCNFDKYECIDSFYCFADFASRTITATPLPGINPDNTEYSMKCSGGYISNTAKVHSFCEFSQNFTMIQEDETVFSVKTELIAKHADVPEFSSFCFCFTPIIAKKEDYISHISFSSLFVSCEYLEDEKILIYKRRPRNSEAPHYCLGIAFTDINTHFNFSTRLEECFSCILTPQSFENVFSENSFAGKTGDLIRPYCKLMVKAKNENNRFSAELLICISDSEEKIIRSLNAARKKSFNYKIKLLSEISDKFRSGAGIGIFGSEKKAGTAEIILKGILFGNTRTNSRFSQVCFNIGKDDIWRHGISGDIPIVTVSLISAQLIPKLEKYIRTVKLLRMCGVRCDLCIIYSEKERYARPIQEEIRNLIEECDCTELISRENGGIFLIDRSLYPSSVNAIYNLACTKNDILYEVCQTQKKHESIKLRHPFSIPILSVDIPLKEEKTIRLSSGDFTENGFTVRKDREYKNPMTQILPGRRLCTLATHNSLGYTWVMNSQNRRITPFCDNPLSDMNGERILLLSGEKLYDLCAMSRYVTFSPGKAVYKGYADGIYFELTVYVSEKLCIKYCDVKLDFPKGSTSTVKLMYVCTPVMGQGTVGGTSVNFFYKDGILCFKNCFSDFFGNYIGFITAEYASSEKGADVKYLTDKSALFTDSATKEQEFCDCACAYLEINASDEFKVYRFMLGAFADTQSIPFDVLKCASNTGQCKFAESFAKSLLPHIKLIPENTNITQKAYSVLFNTFLPYQFSAGRFIARSGFYQSSGAYGFRDQLQDSLALMYSRPEMTLSHIYRCCTRQFPEGDVLHWWHECDKRKPNEVVCKGIRSLCSDDYLWLPFAVCEYFSYSGDREFLSKKIHFACGASLSEDGKYYRERYMEIKRSTECDTVYGHSTRALDRAISKLGSHGLPLIGSCDWCDGYSNIGTETEGESVWLAMFLYIVLSKFCEVCRKMSDTEALDRYSHARTSLLSAIEKHGYSEEEGQYIRAYFANGEKLGSLCSEECKTDLLPQSFAPFIGNIPDERLYTVLKNAYKRLYDEEYNIFKLFTPPFHNSSQEPGYIKGYIPGIRENGGQYTHAAVWGAMGLCVASDILFRHGKLLQANEIRQYAKNALNAQNPVLRHMGYLGEKAANAYRGEPFWLAGDIYSNSSFKGHSGWTLYTGSASWYYRLILENIFGIKLYGISSEERKLEITCDTPYTDKNICNGAELILVPVQGCEYSIKFSSGQKGSILLDGEEIIGKIRITSGKHKIVVTRVQM